MLDDRPDMQEVITTEHPVAVWAASNFNGDKFGSRVYWVADSPRGGFPSEFSPPVEIVPAMIRIAPGTFLTGKDKWASLVFEFHNLYQTEQFNAVSEQAFQGELTAEQYALECVRIEYMAGLEALDFLRENPLPSNKSSSMYTQMMAMEPTFEEYVARHEANKETLGNYDYFKDYYDNAIAPAMQSSGVHRLENTTEGTVSP